MPSLPLFPLPQKSALVGIARLASEGESLREGHNVEYFTLPAKSLLNRCVSRRALPFTWTINPYRGCEFGCQYCYARYTHEFMEMRDGAEFEQKIYVKQHAADLLRRELRRVKTGEPIALGTATDPYQPASAATKSRAAFSKSSPATAASNWGLSPSPISLSAIWIFSAPSRKPTRCRFTSP
jgi:hypothetical protein